jgi:anti-anti-sigma factor
VVQTLVLTPDTQERLLDLIESAKSKLAELGHDGQTITNAEFVCRELVDNAFEHGCPEEGEGEVRIELRISPNYFKCVVEDDGPGFDVESVLRHAAEEAADVSRERGRGLVLVKGMSDQLHFDPSGNRATATLWKALIRGGVSGPEPDDDAAGGGDVAVFQVDRRLDVVRADHLKERMTRAFEEGTASAAILDLSGCDYLDSTGMGVVVKAHTMWAAKRGLVIVGAGRRVMELFQITKLDSVFKFADTVEDARTVLGR